MLRSWPSRSLRRALISVFGGRTTVEALLQAPSSTAATRIRVGVTNRVVRNTALIPESKPVEKFRMSVISADRLALPVIRILDSTIHPAFHAPNTIVLSVRGPVCRPRGMRVIQLGGPGRFASSTFTCGADSSTDTESGSLSQDVEQQGTEKYLSTYSTRTRHLRKEKILGAGRLLESARSNSSRNYSSSELPRKSCNHWR